MPRVRILERYCKSCGLCVSVCPKKGLAIIETRLNELGVHPVGVVAQIECSGCGRCFTVCPDAAIEVSDQGKRAASRTTKSRTAR